MDLEKTWRQDSPNDEYLNNFLDEGKLKSLQSKLPLQKLRTNLLIGIIWAVLITGGYIVLFFFFIIWQVYLCLSVVIIFNILVMIASWRLYRKVPATVTPSNSLKEELLLHYNSFQRWWKLQERISIFVYPVAAAGGFMLGGYIGSGKPVEVFLNNPKILVILAIALLILVPLCYLLARWMFNYAYGRHLKRLKQAIEELT